MNYTFKLKGQQFRPERLNGCQVAAVLLHKFFGIQTKTYRTAKAVYLESWKKHAERIQTELDAERLKGWGFCYQTGKRIEF